MEYSQTLSYLQRYEAADLALRTAAELDPTNYWVKDGQQFISILAHGDLKTALRVTTGVQYSGEPSSIQSFVYPRLMEGRFDESLEAARNMPNELEIQRARIQLREEWLAVIHHLAGNPDESKAAADAAWFRLQGLRDRLGEDYRILHAEVIIAALRGDAPEVIRDRLERAVAARPTDAVEKILGDYEMARALGLAGMTEDVVAWIGPRLASPSVFSVDRMILDPAFDQVRDDLAFSALLERTP